MFKYIVDTNDNTYICTYVDADLTKINRILNNKLCQNLQT